MSHDEFARMIPPEGLQVCEQGANNTAEVLRRPTRGCTTVAPSEVTRDYWRTTLRDRVSGNDRVRCELDGDGERCTTPPVRNEPPNGRVWYLNQAPGQRVLRRVITWSIDM